MLDEMFEWWLPDPEYDGVEKTAPVANFLRRGSFAVAETAIGGGLVTLGILSALNQSPVAIDNTLWDPLTVGGGFAGLFLAGGGIFRFVRAPFELVGDFRYNAAVRRSRNSRW